MRESKTGKGVLDGFQVWVAGALSLRSQVDGQDATSKPPQDMRNYDFALTSGLGI